ncbi:MAG TPA: hypothetical protein GXX33_08760 [Firmicutes bacterium]|nr:hypothetical protein [Bacillota bacterium]
MKKVTSILLCGLLLLLSASQTMASGLSAETFLGNLAQTKKTERVVNGITTTALGIGTGILVSSLASDEELAENEAKAIKTVGYFGAGLLVGAGIITLAIPSEAETHYRDVQAIEDPAAREKAAYSSLVYCAEKAKRERLINGALSAAGALYFLFAEPVTYYDTNYNTYNGLILAASAGASFLIKSVEEKMLEQYHHARDFGAEVERNRSNLRLGWLPDGRIAAVYSYQF